MLKPTLKERLEEILITRNLSSDTLSEVDRDSLDQLCNDLGINLIEKAYIVGFEPNEVFNESFIRGLSFLKLDENGANFNLWNSILNIKAD